MPEYYYEYCVPYEESYDPQESRENRTDPDKYKVVLSNVIYSQNEKIADQQIKSTIKNIRPSYANGFGVMMFTELPEEENVNSFKFSDSDWKERLQRTISDPNDTIIVHRDQNNSF